MAKWNPYQADGSLKEDAIVVSQLTFIDESGRYCVYEEDWITWARARNHAAIQRGELSQGADPGREGSTRGGRGKGRH